MASKEIKIQPDIVKQKAEQMANCTSQIKNTFSNINIEVGSLKQVWDSDASRTFQTKFDNLQDDIQRMFGVAEEYSEDLIAIATTFINTEEEANNLVQSQLRDDVFHI